MKKGFPTFALHVILVLSHLSGPISSPTTKPQDWGGAGGVEFPSSGFGDSIKTVEWFLTPVIWLKLTK